MPIVVRSRHPAGQWVEETVETTQEARTKALAYEAMGVWAEIWHKAPPPPPPKPRYALAETAFR